MARKGGEPLARGCGPVSEAARAALEELLARGVGAVLIRVETLEGMVLQKCIPAMECVATGLDLMDPDE